ncbi:zf-HC2 domain-containing protein [Lysinibacillus sp. Bpr_S20]|uniref:zf-HC2 domain-containing protein n=1 Tax=Lysinibacillus sp. Bpr_S20 TaxID=2933964 RepID=UPI002012F2DA|nr:zf-HC2 domain-containing protein [Lysinibacillus sp. Bpr_S20]MCL1702648.1 zf-HC2 domain-containing protein [Lysinibacillus sp. Bpr_S20]
MKCNVIKDLLPSYVDGICSEDTVEIVEDHLRNCKECKTHLTMMQTDLVEPIPEQVRNAIAPFKKVNKKRRIQVVTATVLTFILTVIGALVIQDVGAVNQIFFPMVSANVNVDSEDNKEEWESLYFEGQKYLIYDSVFWKKEITNTANNENDILLRVKDKEGKIVIEEMKIPPGSSVKLKRLKNNEKYFFEFKTKNGQYLINAT